MSRAYVGVMGSCCLVMVLLAPLAAVMVKVLLSGTTGKMTGCNPLTAVALVCFICTST